MSGPENLRRFGHGDPKWFTTGDTNLVNVASLNPSNFGADIPTFACHIPKFHCNLWVTPSHRLKKIQITGPCLDAMHMNLACNCSAPQEAKCRGNVWLFA